MLKITGYADRLSVAPEEKVAFKISSQNNLPYRAELVRVIHGDCNPQGPGVKLQRHAVPALDGLHPGQEQKTDGGSWLSIPTRDTWAKLHDFTFFAVINATSPHWGEQTIASWLDASGRGFHLGLDVGGRLQARVGDGQQTLLLQGRVAAVAGYWLKVALSYDAQSGTLRLMQSAVQEAATVLQSDTVSVPGKLQSLGHGGDLLMAGMRMPDGQIDRHFNGKIDSPLLLARSLDSSQAAGTFR